MDFKLGQIHDIVIKDLKKFTDSRGWLIETFRSDELAAEHLPVMSYLSITHPGIARGPHEHVAQTDVFAFVGPSMFRVYLWDARKESPTFGSKMVIDAGEGSPMAVIVPPGVVHAYKNIGTTDGTVLNYPNQLFAGKGKKEPVDEIRHENIPHSPFQLD